MDSGLWAALIGIVAGAMGYWFATFSVQPILRFREVRNNVLMNFTYYAQVVNADGLNDAMQVLFRERVLANRKSSAQLHAAINDLPKWYSWLLRWNGLDPSKAAGHLIGYSNTRDWEDAHKLENAIRGCLGLPEEE